MDDPAGFLPQALGGDPNHHHKHQAVLFRALLFLSFEVKRDGKATRDYVAWAEAGYPASLPDGFRPVSKDQRDYALAQWKQWQEWLTQLGITPHDFDRRPNSRQQRERNKLRANAEAAVADQDTDLKRAAKYRALAALQETDASKDQAKVARLWRLAEHFESRGRAAASEEP